VTELRRLREDARLSQEHLAGLSGVSRPTIHRVELGQQSPHGSTVRKLARALGVKPEEVAPERFGSESERPPGYKLTGEVYRRLYSYAQGVARRRFWKRGRCWGWRGGWIHAVGACFQSVCSIASSDRVAVTRDNLTETLATVCYCEHLIVP
jgi:transcriptional regulator with XRE-family HTH domain